MSKPKADDDTQDLLEAVGQLLDSYGDHQHAVGWFLAKKVVAERTGDAEGTKRADDAKNHHEMKAAERKRRVLDYIQEWLEVTA